MDQLDRLQGVLDRFEITIAQANDLVVLEEFEMVVIADDSGSMHNPAAPPGMRQLGQQARSRWDELKETVGEIVEIASCFDKSGIDVFFLNRQPVEGVKSSTDKRFLAAFQGKPAGTTPLTETLNRVVAKTAGERKVLLFILTDGEPNGGKWPFIATLRTLCQKSRGKLRVQIMACTSDEDEMEWLNGVDKELKEVDVTDDYFAEKQEVLKAGLVPRFTRGDWCLKAMIGPVDRRFDAWDEAMGKNKVMALCDLKTCVVS
jgi:hypothetical protein